MYTFLRPFLNKGGAGRYISREESVQRLQPVVTEHLRLLQSYRTALPHLSATAQDRLRETMPLSRMELNKLFETIYSLGGSARTGSEMAPQAAEPLGDDPAERLYALLDQEKSYHDFLLDEKEAVHHQERTRGILVAVAKGSAERINILRELTASLSRPVTA